MTNLSKVLVIDSDPDFAAACCNTWQADSCKVAVASDESQARTMLSARPDVIVLGTLKPAGQAFTLHSWIRQSCYKSIPLMVVDAYYDDMQIKGWRVLEGMNIEADEYVAKPVDACALLPTIKKLTGNGVS